MTTLSTLMDVAGSSLRARHICASKICVVPNPELSQSRPARISCGRNLGAAMQICDDQTHRRQWPCCCVPFALLDTMT
eukprot:4206200-Amphidinium_carterae.1